MQKKVIDYIVICLKIALVFYVCIPALAIAAYGIYCHLINFLSNLLGLTGMPCL